MQSVPIRPYNLTGVAIMNTLNTAVSRVAESLDQVAQLNARYRAGEVHAYVPEALRESERSLEKLIEKHLPASHAALEAASRALFFSLPVAFNPAESVGPYLAVIDRDAAGQPYRFLDMGALLATNAFGENDPAVVRAVLESLPFVTSRYAHSEYQTVLSLRLKAELNRIAPAGIPRHFVVNTGAEAVERPDSGRPRRHAPQEVATGLPDVRLAAYSLSGRGSGLPQGDGASRGAQPKTALGSASVRPDSACREEQGHLPARNGCSR